MCSGRRNVFGVELCAWRGERVYRPHDHNNFNEDEIDALIEYLCTN